MAWSTYGKLYLRAILVQSSPLNGNVFFNEADLPQKKKNVAENKAFIQHLLILECKQMIFFVL